MRSLAEKSGGYVVMSESFEGNIFKQSFKAVFARDAREFFFKYQPQYKFLRKPRENLKNGECREKSESPSH